MSGYITPMLLIVGVSSANSWYNTNQFPVRELVAGGIATGIAGVIAQAKGLAPVVSGIAWLAFIALTIGPVQKPSPLDNLRKIAGV